MIWLLIWLKIKKFNPIVTEMFIRGIKLNISVVFTTQSYFKGPQDVILNSKHYFIMKIPSEPYWKKKDLR